MKQRARFNKNELLSLIGNIEFMLILHTKYEDNISWTSIYRNGRRISIRLKIHSHKIPENIRKNIEDAKTTLNTMRPDKFKTMDDILYDAECLLEEDIDIDITPVFSKMGHFNLKCFCL